MSNLGIVYQQSLKNTIILFVGFALGGINVLFLYTHFLEATYFGLITFLLSAANLIMPLMVFGAQHTVIKFYSSYEDHGDRDSFLWYVLIFPLMVIIPLGVIGTLFYDQLSSFLSRENAIIEKYTYLIFLVAVFMGYFEVFYAWSRVQMRSVFGGFIKEVFARACVSILLFMVYLGWLDNEGFIYAVVVVYGLRLLIMMVYAFTLHRPEFRGWKLPGNHREILSFSVYIILAGSAGTILLEIDKFMIPQMKEITQVAYYSVGVYMASVIAIPSRAMQQIINPITARELNRDNMGEVAHLYRKSSLSLLIIGGWLFLMINTNVREIYQFIGKEEYNLGIMIVHIISIAELIKLSLGTNGAILTNSKYYRVLFYYSLGMAASVVVLNRLLIELMGIEGAALATLIVVAVFSLFRLVYVFKKLSMQPYDASTWKVLILVLIGFLLFYHLELELHPLLTILIKGVGMSLLYTFAMMKLKISEEINGLLRNLLRKRSS